uniref:Uncharacterized protein n=1 Tax=Tanacetum cinerariifolium TaxID=118510 RepID=A0A6L2LM95_TANCI|nr:hypothetical protein [Tanacetum cinerariifolium]
MLCRSVVLSVVGNKMHKAFPLSVIKFPLAKEVPTTSEESSHCQKKRYATAKRISLLILPKEISDYTTLVIQSSIIESLENIALAKSSSQPKSTYKEAASLTEFKLKKIFLDKI